MCSETLEFWNHRLEATDPPLEAAQTQIPHIPDQSEFLERWFEFHQGYRIVRQPDGTESRIAVIGEPWKEVSPGFLPRTLDQLRAGRQNDASRPENVFRRRRLSSEEETPQEIQQSIEEALDHLLEEISDDDAEVDEEQGEDMPRRSSSGLSRPLSRTETSLQRARERLTRVFGTREDIQRDDYESPISTIFNRAEARYRQAEEQRATGSSHPLLDNIENLSRRERRELDEQILWGVLQDSRHSFLGHHQTGNVRSYTPAPLNRGREDSAIPPANIIGHTPPWPTAADDSNSSPNTVSTSSFQSSLGQNTPGLDRLPAPFDAVDTIADLQVQFVRRRPARTFVSEPIQTLDQPGRPEPLTDEQMTKKLDCQICYSQIADIAVLPCGHMVMCQWCADIAVPVRHSHIPVRPSKCPMCRKMVKQRFKIHTGGDDVVLKDGQAPESRARSMRAEIINSDDDVGAGGVRMGTSIGTPD
ncbi:hypothetical protein N0V90_006174 [Kalmusia sp. IMI 367209]|nr:hypothetical protein N0V90_006174 [Kalmusia sp. IMI 367209]